MQARPSPTIGAVPTPGQDGTTSRPLKAVSDAPDHVQQALELEEGLFYVPASQPEPTPRASPERRVPEILAPAGGREQFFAALNAGADAVYLGLKAFNARARAENFDLDDLRALVPLAHQYGMKVLVTVNVLIKEEELETLLLDLGELEALGVDAIIVQDLAVAMLAQTYFPGLRLHASTQMAVHNTAGVLEAQRLGFRRVVLARELTARDLHLISRDVPEGSIEIEAFCHGSLCYSYSGLCFFSGANDARSGNRGECAYTCRQPYRIVSEPGHGFLFSMKDLDTSLTLDLLVDAGVHTLKIEGRKKDAQYVATSVRLYRQQLDQLFGRQTLRDSAPAEAHALYSAPSRPKQAGAASSAQTPGRTHPPARATGATTSQTPAQNGEADVRSDLKLSFHRDVTGFFVRGRYHENVIDLDNPTHLGLEVGPIERIQGRFVRVTTQRPLERFDGLRILPNQKAYHARPQHGERLTGSSSELWHRYQNEVISFSLREMKLRGARVPTVASKSVVEILLPDDVPLPQVGDMLFQWRSADLKRRVEALTVPPREHKLRRWNTIEATISIERIEPPSAGTPNPDRVLLRLSASTLKQGALLTSAFLEVEAQAPREKATLVEDLQGLLSLFGGNNTANGEDEAGFRVEQLLIRGETGWFVPRSQLKALKQQLALGLEHRYQEHISTRIQQAFQAVQRMGRPIRPENMGQLRRFQVKVDRLDYLPWLEAYLADHPEFPLSELTFEPKRMFVSMPDPAALVTALTQFSERTGVAVRMAVPMVLRTWDEAPTRKWLQAFLRAGHHRLELGNLGAFALLTRWQLRDAATQDLDLASDFTLYALNHVASHFWQAQGVSRQALSIEDDLANLRRHLAHWPTAESGIETRPQVILFKDTPLFIAEACSLTALHDGCPTSKVCGYRTLEIENQQGDRFFVAHEQCKSIVYAQKAFSMVEHQKALQQLGIQDFRLDFLTRPYTSESLHTVLNHAFSATPLPDSHSANVMGRLL